MRHIFPRLPTPFAHSNGVVIRTNKGTLRINDTNPDSEQFFYGYADSVEVTTGSACFTSHGIVGIMDLKAGKATADSGAYVGLIKAAAGTTAEEKNGGVFVIPTNALVAEDGNGVSVAVAESLGYTVEIVDEVQVFTPSPAKADKTYFAIYDMTTLRAYRTAINNGTEILLAKVTEDFDMSEEEWLPIGTDSHPFHGTFDGQGHTINGLHSQDSDVWWNNASVGFGKVYGFIGLASGGDVCIKNVSFTNVDISLVNDGKNNGIVLGYSQSGSHSVTFENVTVGAQENDTSRIIGNSHIAGLAGKIYSSGNIVVKNCTNYASVTGTGGYIGGLVGYISSTTPSVLFENCSNYGSITGPTSNGAAGLAGKIISDPSGDILFKGCTNSGVVLNNTTTPGSLTAGIVNISTSSTATIENCINNADVTGGNTYVAGVVYMEGCSNLILKGKIENNGTVNQTSTGSNVGTASGIAYVSNNKTLTLNNAIIKNSGDVNGTKNAGGFIGTEQGVKFSSVGTNSFENTGDITATFTTGAANAGGAFGYINGPVDGQDTIPCSINVHDCTITANGNGVAETERWSSAGGVVGQVDGKGFSFNNVVVKNVTISALGQNDNTYNYAGGFVGMIRMNGQTNKVNVLTNADISTGMTITASHNGTVAGCAYDSQGGSYKNALNYSGSFGSGNALGHSWNNGTITALSE